MRKIVNQRQSLVAPAFTIDGGGSPRNITPSYATLNSPNWNGKTILHTEKQIATVTRSYRRRRRRTRSSGILQDSVLQLSILHLSFGHKLLLRSTIDYDSVLLLRFVWIHRGWCRIIVMLLWNLVRVLHLVQSCIVVWSPLLNLDYRRFMEMVVYAILQNSIQSRGSRILNWETPLLIESRVCLELARVYSAFWLFSCRSRRFPIFHFAAF